MEINYGLIGSMSSCEAMRDRLPEMIAEYFNTGSIQLFGDIVDAGAHFYGLVYDDFDSMEDFVEAMAGMEQEIAFA